MIYGIGLAMDSETYAFADGYIKWKRYLVSKVLTLPIQVEIPVKEDAHD
jgi:hypothetical protein